MKSCWSVCLAKSPKCSNGPYWSFVFKTKDLYLKQGQKLLFIVVYTQTTKPYPMVHPPPLDKPARTSRNQSELDPTSSDWIKLDPLHNTTCNYITPAYLNRETANLDIEYT